MFAKFAGGRREAIDSLPHPYPRREDNMSVNSTKKIRHILEVQGRLGGAVAKLTDTANLYDAGLTSHATVNVMLALEGEFGVEFPDSMLKRSVFESIAAMRTAVEGLTRK